MQALIKDNCLYINGFTCNSALIPTLSNVLKLNDKIINENEKTIFKNTIKGAYKNRINKIQLEISTFINGAKDKTFLFYSELCFPIYKDVITLYPNTKVNNALLYVCNSTTYTIENDGSLSYAPNTRIQAHIGITKDGELYITR